MKLGFLTDGCTDDVEFASENGFGCLEVALFGDSPLYEDCSEFKQACDNADISVSAVSLFGQKMFGEADSVGEGRKNFEAARDLAVELQAPVFVAGSARYEEIPEDEQWEMVIEEMTPMIRAVQDRGLTYAFYNCHWENVVCKPEAWARVLPEVSGAGIKFDPSHPVYDGREWMPDMWKAGDRIVHTHAKDTLWIDGERIPDPNPGLGQMNWGAFFGILYELGLDVDVCIEPHSAVYTGENRYPALLLSKRYLERFLMPEM
ncbi:MAG: sugar phosphate isomerase/epimerase family protein [Candidatus Brocadiia bacterium]